MRKSVGVLAFFTLLFCVGLSGCDGSTSGDKEPGGIFGIPDAPTGVSATVMSGAIQVSWSSVSGATSYYVYRSSSSSGTYNRITMTSSTSYSDNSASPGTTFYYRVSAENNAGEGDQSEFASAKIKLAVPTLSATYDEDLGSIVLSWNSVSGATSYRVDRSTSSSGTYAFLATTPNTTYNDDTDVSPDTTYYYKVCAVNSEGQGEQSAPASVIVPPSTS